MRSADRNWNAHRQLFVVESPTGKKVDLGTSVYADDTMRMYAAPRAQLYKLIGHMKRSSDELNRCLEAYTLKQNEQKRVIVPFVAGSRAGPAL